MLEFSQLAGIAVILAVPIAGAVLARRELLNGWSMWIDRFRVDVNID